MVSKQTTQQKTKSKIGKCFIAFCLTVIAIYAINGSYDNNDHFYPSFISSAQAKEFEKCTINDEKMNAIKQSANGFFKNFRFADSPYDASPLSYKDNVGKIHTMAEFAGKTMLVNLWAIWCIPCRTEMPELATLKRTMGDDKFDVAVINIDKAATDEKIQSFLKTVEADVFPFYRDESMEIFNQIRRDGLALGLPVTLLIDKQGCLIGSFNGSAPWANDDAKALIKATIMQDHQVK